MKAWIIRIAVWLALLALILAVWFGGPMVGYAEVYPLEPVWPRLLIVAIVLLAVGGY